MKKKREEAVENLMIEFFENAPEDVQLLLLSPAYDDAIATIARQFSLDTDKARELEAATHMTILGLTDLKDFPILLQRALLIDLNSANSLVNKIDQVIFSQIRASLDEIHSEETEETTTAPVAPNTQPQTPASAQSTPPPQATTPSASVAATPTKTSPSFMEESLGGTKTEKISVQVKSDRYKGSDPYRETFDDK